MKYQRKDKNMKRLLILTIASLAAIPGFVEQYEPTWESLTDYEAPEWYEDAKLGFWPIWVVYSGEVKSLLSNPTALTRRSSVSEILNAPR